LRVGTSGGDYIISLVIRGTKRFYRLQYQSLHTMEDIQILQGFVQGLNSELGGIVLVVFIVLAHQFQLWRTRQALKQSPDVANQLVTSLDDILRGMKSAYTASGLRDVRRPRDFRAQHVSAFWRNLKRNGSMKTPVGKSPRTPRGSAAREGRTSPAPGIGASPLPGSPRQPSMSASPAAPSSTGARAGGAGSGPGAVGESPAAKAATAAANQVPDEVEGEFGPTAGAATLAQQERAWHGVEAAFSDNTITCFHQPPPAGGR
jgi:hypothetical protein